MELKSTVHALKTEDLCPELAFVQKSQRNDSLHQIGRPDLPEHNIHVKKRKQQEDERRGLVEYNETIKHDNSMPSDQIILSCDQNKAEIADAQEEMKEVMNLQYGNQV